MQIQVEPDALNRAIEKAAYLKKGIQDELNNIEHLILSLDGAWQGESERVYVSKIIYIKREYKKLMAFYDDLVKLLSNISNRYKELERNITSNINQI